MTAETTAQEPSASAQPADLAPDAPPPTALQRGIAVGLTVLALAAVLSPMRLDPQDPKQDTFPLSTYPMFSYDRPRTATVTSAVAVAADGSEQAVPPEFVATSETMQALRTIAKSVRAGRRPALRLCASIAGHVARSPEPAFARAEHVALISVTVDSIRFLAGDRTPLHRSEHVRCPVRRGTP